ncbi:MAG: ribosome assembly cofactor RimP [Sphingobacteriales bacterium]|nr:MAG: ribosome assembly cofactor RimP [Sphingobacteriales bacterium]
MTNETLISTVENMLGDIISPQPDMFLVEIKVKPTNNVKVFIDADSGISIEKCISVNRALYKKMEESGLFPNGDFSLEVSSPGLDEPLKLFRQYKKNIGRSVEVITKDGQRKEGKLIEVTEDGFIVEETKNRLAGKNKNDQGKNKKKEVVNHAFLFDHIKTTKIQAVF